MGRAATLVLALLTACAGGGRGEPTLDVYAAASLREACLELAERFEEVHGARARVNLGASSDLARQILAAHKADVFLSADELQVDRIERAGLLLEETRGPFASNQLVVVVPADASGADAPGDVAAPYVVQEARDLTGVWCKRLALAHPDVVPAGRYARAWLEREGLWTELAPRVVPAVHVRAALAAVGSAAADAGVVYATDAVLDGRVRVVLRVPPERGPQVAYVAAALADRPDEGLSRSFLALLRGVEGQAILARHGFLPPRSGEVR